METYITMLRGINVGGRNKIKMDTLRAMYDELGYKNVRSYIQSGNVIFEHTEGRAPELAKTIRKAIDDTYGYEVNVIVRTTAELESISKGNPFVEVPGIDFTKLCVVFLDRPPADPPGVEEMADRAGTDEIAIINNEIYLYCPGGFAQTKLTNNFWEKRLSCIATTRNWNGVNKLLALAANKE